MVKASALACAAANLPANAKPKQRQGNLCAKACVQFDYAAFIFVLSSALLVLHTRIYAEGGLGFH